MGQKVSAISFRTQIKKDWRSRWIAVDKKRYAEWLLEDLRLRRYLEKRFAQQGISEVLTRRMGGKIEVTLRTSRPGLIIGRKGAGIDQLRQDLKGFTKSELWLEVEEIKRPDMDPRLLAHQIARQLERRMPFRRVLKRVMQLAMDAGALGVKVQIGGRLGGAEIARTEWYKRGRIPLHTIRADVDYGVARSNTTYGVIGVKVWVNLPENEQGAKA